MKKSRSFEELDTQIGMVAIEEVTTNILSDYFTNDIAGLIYAPKVLDMAICTNANVWDELHLKGYLMMQIVPQNTGTKMFKNPECQKWEHQKPYLLDILSSVNELAKRRVFMTDLKPDNTLYDKELRKGTLIDLAGVLKALPHDDLSQFDFRQREFQFTLEYVAPELILSGRGAKVKPCVNMYKAMSYSCGKLLQYTITKDITDITAEMIVYHPYKDDLAVLINNLIDPDPGRRIYIAEAISKLRGMGTEDFKALAVFSNYVIKVRHRIQFNKSSISLNEDIEEAKRLFINLDATTLDPNKNLDAQRYDLFQSIDNFISGTTQSQVFLLLGEAGAGKSVVLQLKFIEAIHNWHAGEPLPIYFNLANGTNLEEILLKLNQELGTDLTPTNLCKHKVHLYVDSFDEGIGETHVKERNCLIQKYFEILSHTSDIIGETLENHDPLRHKIIISCRANYLTSETAAYEWFQPKSSVLQKNYIAPLNYTDDKVLKQAIQKYLENNSNLFSKYDVEWYLKNIHKAQLTELVSTGYMFYIIMNTLPKLLEFHPQQRLTASDIYQQYVQNYFQEAKEHLALIPKQYDKILELSSARNFEDLSDKLGECMAAKLYLEQKVRLHEDSALFQLLGYSNNIDFNHQRCSRLFSLIPAKVEVTRTKTDSGEITERIAVGFKHDTLKNYYLVQAIFKQVNQKDSGRPNILAAHSIIKT